ncbi:nucleotidyl transferase AbiEii/AbiGii toxin family protein [Lachnoclostridium sp. Marseille-P6806]|uniref:nucleotidyl transferase AbiEii/AbiGii toxin family protein n=1 Tax=Lachnoclostridium sp. Marseille-P6806 TaxID=2364793 RepID=UPI0010315295|nr:nucleotidyl transferase AbiEii/AbiGii toxin family protein [Lachnoclostridium sp. Marseille-P6806]
MFEDRTILLWTYNLETLLAEKLETIMARGTANTRMRDFYDIHVISRQEPLNPTILKQALFAASSKRNTTDQINNFRSILVNAESDDAMRRQWENFRKESFFIDELMWDEVMESVKLLAESVL